MGRETWAATPLRCVLLTRQEFGEREKARRANVDEHRRRRPGVDYISLWTPELRAEQAVFFPPGSMWECPGYFDIDDADDRSHLPEMRRAAESPGYAGLLSVHYYRDWADKRAPIVVVCPDGVQWVVDSKSTNGSGWTVTGEAPLLTCSPSIWTQMSNPDSYHGYLRDGLFTDPV